MPFAPTLLAPPSARPARLDSAAVAASQRDRMLRAMVQACAEKGYGNVAIADVVGRARVSRKTFYEHFADKEACFLTTYDTAVNELASQVERAIRPQDPDEDPVAAVLKQLPLLFGTYLDALAAEPDVARAYLVDVYAAGPNAIARRRVVLGRFAALVTALHAQAGMPGGPLDPLEAEAIVGAISTMATTRVATGHASELPELTEPLCRFIAGWLLDR